MSLRLRSSDTSIWSTSSVVGFGTAYVSASGLSRHLSTGPDQQPDPTCIKVYCRNWQLHGQFMLIRWSRDRGRRPKSHAGASRGARGPRGSHRNLPVKPGLWCWHLRLTCQWLRPGGACPRSSRRLSLWLFRRDHEGRYDTRRHSHVDIHAGVRYQTCKAVQSKTRSLMEGAAVIVLSRVSQAARTRRCPGVLGSDGRAWTLALRMSLQAGPRLRLRVKPEGSSGVQVSSGMCNRRAPEVLVSEIRNLRPKTNTGDVTTAVSVFASSF